MITKPLGERHWDVQGGTGFASSTVPQGQWYRGVLYRAAMPALSLPPYNAMRDPSWSPTPRGRGLWKRGRR